MTLKYSLEENINTALMIKEPIVIVEGQDDVKFYNNIAEIGEISVDVQAIEMIDGYAEGCEQVCKAIDKVEELIENDERVKKYVVGIIDRDVRQYLGELPEKNNLLVLKYYSYETHLITDITIKKMLEVLTKASGEMITDEVINWLKNKFKEQSSKEIYYFSLEALKKRMDNTYESEIQYGARGGAVIGCGRQHMWAKIAPKIDELDEFAVSQNISIEDLKYIVKGKWFLDSWCDFLIEISKKLKDLCGINLPKCRYCIAGIENKCLWKYSSKFQIEQIKSMLCTKEFIDIEEVKYISDYIKTCCELGES